MMMPTMVRTGTYKTVLYLNLGSFEQKNEQKECDHPLFIHRVLRIGELMQ